MFNMEMEKEKQALSEEQVSDVAGGKVDWKKTAKIAAATSLGAAAVAGAAIGGKKLYDGHKKDEPIYYMDGEGIGHDALNTAKSIDDVD